MLINASEEEFEWEMKGAGGKGISILPSGRRREKERDKGWEERERRSTKCTKGGCMNGCMGPKSN